MPEVILLTNRLYSPFVQNVIGNIASAAGITVRLMREAPKEPIKWLMSEHWKVPENVESFAVFPLNEDNFPSDSDNSWKGRARFFLSQSEQLRGAFASRSMKVSTIIDHPFCMFSAESLPEPGSTRSVKILLPSYGDWTPDDISHFLPLLAGAMAKDFKSLENVEFVVEGNIPNYQSVAGESVYFYDDANAFLPRLLDSKIVCCMGSQYVMEMSWLSRMRQLKATNAVLMAESVLDGNITKQSMLDNFASFGHKGYSHMKLVWSQNHQVSYDQSHMRHLFTYSSAFGGSTRAFVNLLPSELSSTIGADAPYDKEIATWFVGSRELREEEMASKLQKLIERMSA